MKPINPLVPSTLIQNIERSRAAAEHKKPANSISGHFVLIVRKKFHAGETLFRLLRSGLRRVARAINYHF